MWGCIWEVYFCSEPLDLKTSTSKQTYLTPFSPKPHYFKNKDDEYWYIFINYFLSIYSICIPFIQASIRDIVFSIRTNSEESLIGLKLKKL